MSERPSSRSLAGHWRDPAVLCACGFGSGFLPIAPGTWGSAAALAVWWLLLESLPWWQQLPVVAVTFGLGVWLVNGITRRYGVGDDPAIVVDEFAGLWLALVAAPPGIGWALAGFALFRLFDVAKPWPIRWADGMVRGGLGVMLDDVIAGLFTLTVIQVSFWGMGHIA